MPISEFAKKEGMMTRGEFDKWFEELSLDKVNAEVESVTRCAGLGEPLPYRTDRSMAMAALETFRAYNIAKSITKGDYGITVYTGDEVYTVKHIDFCYAACKAMLGAKKIRV